MLSLWGFHRRAPLQWMNHMGQAHQSGHASSVRPHFICLFSLTFMCSQNLVVFYRNKPARSRL